MTTTIDTFSALNASANASSSRAATSNEAGSADRFLRLLVTQMQNQDPLNPMDNAELTSQLAQINTVNGIEKLNTTMTGMNTQFAQLQTLQGVSLVGRDVTVAGNRMAFDQTVGVGGFELVGAATNVKVEVLNGVGQVVDTVQLGAQGPGMRSFNWQAADKALPAGSDAYRFRVVASSGSQAVAVAPLMRDRVEAVSMSGTELRLQTQWSGQLAYAAVKAFN